MIQSDEINNETEHIRYLYDGINVLMEKDGNGNTLATYTLSPGVIKEIISVRKSGADLFYHYDPIGNVLFVSDTSGNINTSYVQEGFGNVIATSGSASNSYHLTTKEQDPDTGMYYFSARWYDPSAARFVSWDPILHGAWPFANTSKHINTCSKGINHEDTTPGSHHPYIYVNQNPINSTDPSGYGTTWDCANFYGNCCFWGNSYCCTALLVCLSFNNSRCNICLRNCIPACHSWSCDFWIHLYCGCKCISNGSCP